MSDLMAYPPFPGFREEAFTFLRQLEDNNERDWFKPRKETYVDEVRGPLECLIADVARRLHEAGLPLTGDPKKSRFRIYRDTRFSNDKRPYKTNVGCVFDRSGSKDKNGVVYVHVEPGASFLAGGFYQPEVKYLRPVRERIAQSPAVFFDLLKRMEERGLTVHSRDDTLTGMPRGFSQYKDDEELADVLRWKHYLVNRDVDDERLTTPAFAEDVVQMAEDAMPLLEFVWDAAEGGA
jgi:uncharacterized protein (TIGR02453 family)